MYKDKILILLIIIFIYFLFFKNKNTFVNKKKKKKKKEKYVIVKGHQGFGDRLQFFLYSIHYSRITGRVLISDWKDHEWGDGKTDFYDYFNLKKIKNMSLQHFSKIYKKKSMSIIPKFWKDKLFDNNVKRNDKTLLFGSKNEPIIEICKQKRKDFKEDVVVIIGLRLRIPYYKNIKYLSVNDTIKEQILHNSIFSQLKDNKYIIVHLRGGDKLAHKLYFNKNVSKDSYIENLVNKTEKEISKSEIKNILIISDTENFIEMFRKKFKIKQVNLYTNNNFLLPKDIEHIGLHRLKDNMLRTYNLDKKKLNFFTILDFVLLLNAEKIICDNVTRFANVAKFIKNKAEKPYLGL